MLSKQLGGALVSISDRYVERCSRHREALCFGTKVGPVVNQKLNDSHVPSAYLFPPLSPGGASIAEPFLRFHTPLIEPDGRY